MNDKKPTWLAWTLCGIVIVGALFSFALMLDDPGVRDNAFAFANAILNTLFTIVFGVVGALILGRHARHAIGWLLMVIALSLAGFGSVQNYLAQTIPAIPEPTLPTLLYFWLSGWTWWLLIGPLLLILLLFPTGRLLSPRWRWVVVTLAILFGIFLLYATFSPTL